MSANTLEGFRRNDGPPLVPWWHTALLVGTILAVAVTGTVLTREGRTSGLSGSVPRISGLYLPMIAVQCLLIFYVARVGRPRGVLRQLIGRGWTSATVALADVSIAALAWTLIEVCEVAWARLDGAGRAVAIVAGLPHSPGEQVTWVIVAVTVGFGEEVVYRGYLQNQFNALTGGCAGGALLQSAIFGAAHAEQGFATSLRFALYAFGLAMLANWRRSLLPGILCHVGLDLLGGLIR